MQLVVSHNRLKYDEGEDKDEKVRNNEARSNHKIQPVFPLLSRVLGRYTKSEESLTES